MKKHKWFAMSALRIIVVLVVLPSLVLTFPLTSVRGGQATNASLRQPVGREQAELGNRLTRASYENKEVGSSQGTEGRGTTATQQPKSADLPVLLNVSSVFDYAQKKTPYYVHLRTENWRFSYVIRGNPPKNLRPGDSFVFTIEGRAIGNNQDPEESAYLSLLVRPRNVYLTTESNGDATLGAGEGIPKGPTRKECAATYRFTLDTKINLTSFDREPEMALTFVYGPFGSDADISLVVLRYEYQLKELKGPSGKQTVLYVLKEGYPKVNPENANLSSGGYDNEHESARRQVSLEAEPESGPTITLDRQAAARFGAILLTGRGFKPHTFVNIMWEGKELYRIMETLPDGSVPRTWIWVPDDAPFGVNKVWAEEGGTPRKTKPVEVNATKLSMKKLVENFDAVVEQYLHKIPKNTNWHTGGKRNIAYAAKAVGAGVVYVVTVVFTLGTHAVDLFPDNKFLCSWYQAEVLAFLDELRFDEDPAKRAVLDGLDYGPFTSGIFETETGSHFFVVVWPHGPALDPDLFQGFTIFQGMSLNWDNSGIAFDPWPKQAPWLFELKSDTAFWAKSSAYFDQWLPGSYTYVLPRPVPSHMNFPSFRNLIGRYPITGGRYYTPTYSRGGLATDLPGIGGEPPKSLSVHSPVRLEVKDTQGRRAGMRPDGELFDEIPGAEILVIPQSEGSYEWYVALPKGQLEITVTGTAEGSYQLLTKNLGQPIYQYPSVPVAPGATATITLHDQSAPKALRTDKGQELFPTKIDRPTLQPYPTKRPTIAGQAVSQSQGKTCFAEDPGAGSTDREANYGWAQRQNAAMLEANLKNKAALLFRCPSMNVDRLSSAFASVSVIIAKYVPDAKCFGGDAGVVGANWSNHKSWGMSKGVDIMVNNLQWKMAAAMKCMDRSHQLSFFADVSVAIASTRSQ